MLRFLKIITPVKCVKPLYDGYIRIPKEGELHWTYKCGRIGHTVPLVQPVWSLNIDQNKKHSMKRGLQLLWDT